MPIQLKEYQNTITGVFKVQYDELVGTGKNWFMPAKVLGMDLISFLEMLKGKYEAEINFYYKPDRSISFIGYSWTSQSKMRAFKNYTNKVARDKKFTIA